MSNHNQFRYRYPAFWRELNNNATEISAGKGIPEAESLIEFVSDLTASREVIRITGHTRTFLNYRMSQIRNVAICLDEARAAFLSCMQSESPTESQAVTAVLGDLISASGHIDYARGRLRRNLGLSKYEA